MIFQAVFTPEASIFFLIAVVYVVGKRYMEKSIQRNQLRSIEEQMAKIAAADQCSVYDLFHKAGEIWNFSKPKIEADFKAYLQRGELPPYITDYVRKRKQVGNLTCHRPLTTAGIYQVPGRLDTDCGAEPNMELSCSLGDFQHFKQKIRFLIFERM